MIYYGNLHEKCVSGYKLFWKTAISFNRDKVVGKDRIYLTENEIVKTDLKAVEILNAFFLMLYKMSRDQRMKNHDLVVDNVKDPALKAVLK